MCLTGVVFSYTKVENPLLQINSQEFPTHSNNPRPNGEPQITSTEGKSSICSYSLHLWLKFSRGLIFQREKSYMPPPLARNISNTQELESSRVQTYANCLTGHQRLNTRAVAVTNPDTSKSRAMAKGYGNNNSGTATIIKTLM